MFSVIIPTYNSADRVTNAIKSVLAQTYDQFEIIVVDDGSTDHTFQMVKQLDDYRIRYFFKENGGPASARNHGIKNAIYEYLCFLDADDIFLPTKLACMVEVTNTCEKADLIFSDALYINEKTNVKFRFYEDREIFTGQIFRLLLKDNFLINSTVVVKKSKLMALDVQFDEDEKLKFVEDYDLWLKLALKKLDFFYVDKVLTNYYIHEQNGSQNAIRTYKSLISIYKKYLFVAPSVLKQIAQSYLRIFYLSIKN